MSSGITSPFGELFLCPRYITYALLTRPPLTYALVSQSISPFDLHALATPPAFVLSQDQTLQFISVSPSSASEIGDQSHFSPKPLLAYELELSVGLPPETSGQGPYTLTCSSARTSHAEEAEVRMLKGPPGRNPAHTFVLITAATRASAIGGVQSRTATRILTAFGQLFTCQRALSSRCLGPRRSATGRARHRASPGTHPCPAGPADEPPPMETL